ncbi:MAG: MAPEG family protein [Burkholderiales bacterium]
MVVTPLYAGLLVLWFVLLSIRVIRRRGSDKIMLGDGGNQGFLRVIRAQANFAEYVPLALLLMVILELSHFSIYVLHALGVLLVVARLLHGYALSFTTQFAFGRIAGAGLTFFVLLIEAVLCLYQALLAMRLT